MTVLLETNLDRVLGKTIEGLSTIGDPDCGRHEIQLALSDGSELRIVNPESVEIKEPSHCPQCGQDLEGVK